MLFSCFLKNRFAWAKQEHVSVNAKKHVVFLMLIVISAAIWSTNGTFAFANQNHAPVITDFGAEQGPWGFWTFSGTVTDEDYDIEGMSVDLGGVVSGYGLSAVIDEYGNFSVTAELPELESGTVTADTMDYCGLPSNTAACIIIGE